VCRLCFTIGDLAVAGMEGKRYCGGRWRSRNVGRALITRSGSGPERNLWSHQRFDKRARKFIGSECGKERRVEEREDVGKVVALFRWPTLATMF